MLNVGLYVSSAVTFSIVKITSDFQVMLVLLSLQNINLKKPGRDVQVDGFSHQKLRPIVNIEALGGSCVL